MFVKPENKLLLQWSPIQIAGSLKTEGVLISHESIYRYILERQADKEVVYIKI